MTTTTFKRGREKWLREVDRLAAVEILGREVTSDAWGDPAYPEPKNTWTDPQGAYTGNPQHHGDWVERFTTSISDAWKLVEALCESGRTVTLHIKTGFCDCQSFLTKDGMVRHETWDGTEWPQQREPAPLAITLAALKAVGCEIPEEPTRE